MNVNDALLSIFFSLFLIQDWIKSFEIINDSKSLKTIMVVEKNDSQKKRHKMSEDILLTINYMVATWVEFISLDTW